MKKKRIGFDFDKVFVNYPPFVPDFLIDYLYKKRNGKLTYRFPGFFEKQIRILSHAYIFRPPIDNNLAALKKISTSKDSSIYLISSRFSFLRERTESWLKRTGVGNYFTGIYFNYDDRQPHLFKDSVIKKEKIQHFIDDDYDLLKYLASKNPNVKFFWINNKNIKSVSDNIIGIKNIEEYRRNYY